MQLEQITKILEKFAPLETQEKWDNSGLQIEADKDINKILICLTITDDIIKQATDGDFDLIISHHPLFFVPFSFKKNFSIYSMHTNFDKASGGTTDTLINTLGFNYNKAQKIEDFLRIITLDKKIYLSDFISNIKEKLNLKKINVVNNFSKKDVQKIAFCSGSGADFTNLAESNFADILVTGDIKFHAALDSKIILADAGHFETEYPSLKVIKELLQDLGLEVVIADEKSPFTVY